MESGIESDKKERLRQEVLSLNKVVSVIIPFYDDIRGMNTSIASVTNQLPHKLREIIIVDCKKSAIDDEKSEQRQRKSILKRYECLDKATIVSLDAEDAEGYGGGAERNARFFGAAQAHGDYLLFLNQGDALTGNFLAGILTDMAQERADFAVSNTAVRWPSGDNIQAYQDEKYIFGDDGRFFSDYVEKAKDFWGWSFLGNKIIRRDLWERASGTLEKALSAVGKRRFYGEDLVFASALWKEARKVVPIAEKYVIFSWGKEDSFFKSAMSAPMSIVQDIKFSLDFLYGLLNKEDDDFFPINDAFIRRFWWRSEWTLKGEERERVKAELARLFSVEDLAYSGDGVCVDFAYDKEGLFEGEEEVSDKKVKIYVAMHEQAYVPENNKYLVPIQVGTALNEEKFADILHDDEGDNISAKHNIYHELTAQYFAYKNDSAADYYGFWTSHKYFAFSEDAGETEESSAVSCKDLTEGVLNKYGVDERRLAGYCSVYDVILPKRREIAVDGKSLSAYEFLSRTFEKRDLDLFVTVVKDKYPAYSDALMETLDAKTTLDSHIFIMRKDIFHEYSAFLFDILAEIERSVAFSLRKQRYLKIIDEFAKVLLATFANSLEKSERYSVFNAVVIAAEHAKPFAKVVKPKIPEGLRRVTICLACNNEYIKYTSVLLASIYANSGPDSFYDIVILHRDITETSRRVCKTMFDNADNFLLRFCDVSRNFDAYHDVYISRHLTYEAYYRFFIPDIFKGYDKVLYLDCDMIADADVAELFEADLTGKYIGAVRDAGFIILANSPNPDSLHVDTLGALQFSEEEIYGYFNSGLILFNIAEVKKDFTVEKMFETALSRQWSFHDQDTLNFLFKGKAHYFDVAWNLSWYSIGERTFLTGEEPAIVNEWATAAIKAPKLIHFSGQAKPWRPKAFNLSNFTVNLFWKYARKSPYYELLVSKLTEFTSAPTGWLVFVCPPRQNYGARFFEIHVVDIMWSSSYLYIDFMYLSDHAAGLVDTLRISISRFPTDDGASSYLVLRDYCFEKGLDVFKTNIGIRFEGNKKLVVFAKNPQQYSGFAFSARFLESRDDQKPHIIANNRKFIHEGAMIELPQDLQYAP
jgi:lipopolysaccharide biosynthesis glycosyltransferase